MTYDTEEARQKHREEQRKYLARHPNANAEAHRKHRQIHPETIEADRAYLREWRKTPKGREARRKGNRRFWELHKDALRKRHREYYATEAGKQARRLANYRRRGIAGPSGYLFSLNQRFIGSQFHHLSERIGVWIPTTVHQGHQHDLRSGRGMIEMNEAEANWLGSFSESEKE